MKCRKPQNSLEPETPLLLAFDRWSSERVPAAANKRHICEKAGSGNRKAVRLIVDNSTHYRDRTMNWYDQGTSVAVPS